jgi:hypothetical protein
LGGGGVGNNTVVGNNSLGSNTSGAYNTVVGQYSAVGNTTGSGNSVFGQASFYTNTTGSYNTAIGGTTLPNNTTGGYNVAVGYNALTSNTTSSNNTAVGYQAGYSLTGGANTCIGYGTGGSTSGVYNGLFVGYGAQASGATAQEMVICTTQSSVSGKGSNTGFINPNGGGVYQGNNSASWSTTSDVRIKENVIPIPSGLSVLGQLNPVTFDYILTKKADVGFIAQEFQKVLPDQVQEHAASPEEKTLTGSDTLFGINPNLVPYLVKAIQELSAEITALKAQLHAANVTGF